MEKVTAKNAIRVFILKCYICGRKKEIYQEKDIKKEAENFLWIKTKSGYMAMVCTSCIQKANEIKNNT